MNQFHSTTITELELAEEFSVDPIVILSWVAKDLLQSHGDEVGLCFTPTAISDFKRDHGLLIEPAVAATERIARIKTARRSLDEASSA